ncbi:hypothetical protein EYF80_027419 [Liparis tanakae]|uniref:Uncharacterized protein n=1 Tax=Liparis tanakae TaxID=230148 RepID=A0A4Z2H947_9TELE|nr:hypothetical protein EYF80_027419 [Liparis tanakae]
MKKSLGRSGVDSVCFRDKIMDSSSMSLQEERGAARAVLDLLEHDTVSCHGTVPSTEKRDVKASLTPMASFDELLPAILPRCGIGSTSDRSAHCSLGSPHEDM